MRNEAKQPTFHTLQASVIFVLVIALGLLSCAGTPHSSYNQGIELIISGNPKDAESAFLNEITKHPDNDEAWNQLGIIAFEENQYELAKIRFNQAMGLDPLNWAYPRNLALVYAERKQYEIAHDLLQRSLNLNPSDPKTYLTLAKVYLLLDQTESAQTALQRCLKLDPANQEAKRLKENLKS